MYFLHIAPSKKNYGSATAYVDSLRVGPTLQTAPAWSSIYIVIYIYITHHQCDCHIKRVIAAVGPLYSSTNENSKKEGKALQFFLTVIKLEKKKKFSSFVPLSLSLVLTSSLCSPTLAIAATSNNPCNHDKQSSSPSQGTIQTKKRQEKVSCLPFPTNMDPYHPL